MGLTPPPPNEQDISPDRVAATRSLVARQEAEQKARIKFLRSVAPEKKPKSKFAKAAGWTLLVLIILGGLGFGGWKLWASKPASKPAAAQKAVAKPKPLITSKTKHVDSSTVGLGFDYPADWVVSDQNGSLTVTSPPLELKTALSQSVTARIVLTVKPQGAKLAEFNDGNALAATDSEKMSYAKPSPTQRAESYLSFLNYASSSQNGLDGIYVTGDNGYKAGQAIPEVDIAKGDPLITVTFKRCPDTKCSGQPDPLTISSAMWSQTDFNTPIKKMLTSITVE